MMIGIFYFYKLFCFLLGQVVLKVINKKYKFEKIEVNMDESAIHVKNNLEEFDIKYNKVNEVTETRNLIILFCDDIKGKGIGIPIKKEDLKMEKKNFMAFLKENCKNLIFKRIEKLLGFKILRYIIHTVVISSLICASLFFIRNKGEFERSLELFINNINSYGTNVVDQ